MRPSLVPLGGLVWFGRHARVRKMTQCRKVNLKDHRDLMNNTETLTRRPFLTVEMEHGHRQEADRLLRIAEKPAPAS